MKSKKDYETQRKWMKRIQKKAGRKDKIEFICVSMGMKRENVDTTRGRPEKMAV